MTTLDIDLRRTKSGFSRFDRSDAMAEDEANPGYTLSATCDFLNRELAACGFPSPLKLYKGEESNNEETRRIIDCLFAMLQQHQRDSAAQDSMVERVRKLTSDNEALNESYNRAKSRLESAEKEAETATSKLSLAQKQLQEANIKHSLTKEELKVARNNLAHVKQQCQHELRKKERENEKLKDRINKASNDRSQQSKRAVMRCLNALPKAGGSMLHDQDSDNDMYRVVIANYEEREQDVLAENLALRRLLYSIYADLNQIAVGLELPRDSTTFNMDEQGNLEAVDLTDPSAAESDHGRFQIAFELVQSTLEAKIRELLESCYEQIFTMMEAEKNRVDTGNEQEQKLAEDAKLIQELEHQLAKAKAMTKQQQELLEVAVKSSATSSNQEALDEMATELKREQKEMERMRNHFEEERKKFAEAAVRMGAERLKLQKEKDEFEAEKRKMATQKLLKDLPTTPAFLKASGGQAAYNPATTMSPLGDDFFKSPTAAPGSKPAALTSNTSQNRSFYSSNSPGATFDVSAIRAKASAISGAAPKAQDSARKRVYSSRQTSFLAGDESNVENDDILVETETLSGTPTDGGSPNGLNEKPASLKQDSWRAGGQATAAGGARKTFSDRLATVR